jgi:hypothetical protein
VPGLSGNGVPIQLISDEPLPNSQPAAARCALCPPR